MVTVVLLGGVSIFGGRGTIVGVVLAVAVLGTLQTAMTADVIPADQNIVVGAPSSRASSCRTSGEIYRRARPGCRLPEPAATLPSHARRQGSGRPSRVAVFGIGLAAYWPSSTGCASVSRDTSAGSSIGSRRWSERRLGRPRRHPAGARAAGEALAGARPQLLLVYTATYATSSQVLPVVQAVDAPVVVLNLQPTRSLDYEAMTTGEWLANCSACCVPEIAGALTRAAIPYRTVTGTLLDGDPAGTPCASGSTRARRARPPDGAHRLPRPHVSRNARHVLDFTQVHAQTSAHVEVLEIDDLVARVESAETAAIERKEHEISEVFDLADAGTDPIAAEITPEVFDWSTASPSASIDSSRTSSSTVSPTTTAASATTSPSA